MENFLERARSYRDAYTITSRAHYLASAGYATLNRWFGVPTIVLSVLAGGTILTKLAESSPTWNTVAGVLALASAVLSAIHNFLGFGSSAERHKAAGEAYRNIKRKFEIFLLEHEFSTEKDRDAVVRDYKAILGKIEEMAPFFPSVPDHFYAKARKEIES